MMVRRAIAIGGGILIVILLVVGINGCLDMPQGHARSATTPPTSARS